MNDIIQQLAPYLVSIVIGGLTYLITYLKTKTINLVGIGTNYGKMHIKNRLRSLKLCVKIS